MDKTLQTTAWRCLPREFKEEVKKEYKIYSEGFRTVSAGAGKWELRGCYRELEDLFGVHNLTSDAEGEVMLTAMKWKVQEQYANYNKELQHDGLRHIEYEKAKEVVKVLYYLFGSKCLRDETCNVASKEPNPAEEYDVFNDPEPKCLHFKDGKCAHPAVAHLENGKLAKGADCDVSSCEDVEYEPNPAEPKEEADEHFDTIVKGGFRNERRLNIAAQITASIYANDKAASRFDSIEALVRKALEIADTLIAECEKGGNHD